MTQNWLYLGCLHAGLMILHDCLLWHAISNPAMHATASNKPGRSSDFAISARCFVAIAWPADDTFEILLVDSKFRERKRRTMRTVTHVMYRVKYPVIQYIMQY